jgi:SAM-dependent methyltransferase
MLRLKQLIRKQLVCFSKKYSRKGLYEFINEACSRMPDGLAVLNVGAGGDVEEAIKKSAANKNWKIVSLDIDVERNPTILGSIEDVDLPDGTFDAIFMIEVLEHVLNVENALANSHRLLAQQGKLVASVPFMLPIHDAPYDFLRFTEHGLILLFSAFTNIEIRARNGYFESCAVIAMRSLTTERGGDWPVLAIVTISVFIIGPLARLVDKLVPMRGSTTGYTVYCCR